jgi:lysophospholipase L1-like esterase
VNLRVKVFAFLSAALLFVLAALPASASSEGHSYLALGDSVSFGFNPDPSLWPNADNFTGYPEIVAQRLNIEEVNASCPGEATGGFLDLNGTDNLCRPFRFLLRDPLHVSYSGTQMAFATAYLGSHPRTRLVTLTLGANDVFRWLTDCQLGSSVGTCPLGLGRVLAIAQANLNTIFQNLRATGYTGLIVALTYYSDNYNNILPAVLLNSPMVAAATANRVPIASGIHAWAATAIAAGGGISCAAGLLLPAFPPGTAGCDVHPTPLGRDLLAAEVISTIAASCPAHSAIGCLDRNRD